MPNPGPVGRFLERNFLHYNAGEVLRAAQSFVRHIEAGGKMFVSLGGAMSTAKLGNTLAEMIKRGYISGISCTGANLEEDLFAALRGEEFRRIPDWRALRAKDETALYQEGWNRVTDICIPKDVMFELEGFLLEGWKKAESLGLRKSPAEFIFDAIDAPGMVDRLKASAHASWVVAAKDAGVPIFTPGWEDSTTGNAFATYVMRGELDGHDCVLHGTAQFERLLNWYSKEHGKSDQTPSMGYFQIGGGIAGDFAVCAVPMLIQDLERSETPFWGYFCQISDAVTSYGGYSGAVPNEKITWGKLEEATPSFMIESDATIVAPLIFAYVLGE